MASENPTTSSLIPQSPSASKFSLHVKIFTFHMLHALVGLSLLSALFECFRPFALLFDHYSFQCLAGLLFTIAGWSALNVAEWRAAFDMNEKLKKGLPAEFASHVFRLGRMAQKTQAYIYLAIGITALAFATWWLAVGFKPQLFENNRQSSLLFFWLGLGPGWLARVWARFRSYV